MGDETELVFTTWWETEPGIEWDQKLVQWCEGANWTAASSNCTTVLQVTDQKQEMMGGMGGPMDMMGPMMGPMMCPMLEARARARCGADEPAREAGGLLREPVFFV